MNQSILAGVTSGVTRSGLRILIAGQEKLGKTTLCSNAPGALLIPLEVGFAGVSVAKTQKLDSLAQVRGVVRLRCTISHCAIGPRSLPWARHGLLPGTRRKSST
jgi:hypothetical protein